MSYNSSLFFKQKPDGNKEYYHASKSPTFHVSDTFLKLLLKDKNNLLEMIHD